MKLNREQYAREFAKMHHGYEVQAYRLFKKALDLQTKAVREHVKKSGVILLDVILPMLLPKEPMQDAYWKAYELIGVQHARFTYKYLQQQLKGKESYLEEKGIGIAFSSEYWRTLMAQYYLTHAANKVNEVDSTTIANLKKILAVAQEQEMSMLQMADYILEEIEHPDFNRNRALRIARTESTTAANAAGHLVAEEAEFETEKVWINVSDNRTRHSHYIMGGKEPIDLGAMFEVPNPKGGVDYALYPGGPGLSAANIVNCRCTHATTAKLDSDGLPILR